MQELQNAHGIFFCSSATGLKREEHMVDKAALEWDIVQGSANTAAPHRALACTGARFAQSGRCSDTDSGEGPKNLGGLAWHDTYNALTAPQKSRPPVEYGGAYIQEVHLEFVNGTRLLVESGTCSLVSTLDVA